MNPPPENVFILGAGASAHTGAPMMGDFLDRSRELFAGSRTGKDSTSFELVFRALSKLQIAHSKSSLDLDNIESVLGAFDMAKLLGKFPDLQPDEIENLSSAMVKVIVTTLVQCIQFPTEELTAQSYRVGAHPNYLALASLVDDIRADVITFNYDVAFDFAMFQSEVPVSYGFSPERPNERHLLKLHGSMNWTKCPKCEKIIEGKMPSDCLAGKVFSTLGLEAFHWDFCCGQIGQPVAVIVPPSFDKSEHRKSIIEVWKRAAIVLSRARNIFVCGYSLPDSDLFFRYLYSLGSIGFGSLERFWVFNPDPALESRFRMLLGPGAHKRFRFEKVTLEGATNLLRNEFPVKKKR